MRIDCFRRVSKITMLSCMCVSCKHTNSNTRGRGQNLLPWPCESGYYVAVYIAVARHRSCLRGVAYECDARAIRTDAKRYTCKIHRCTEHTLCARASCSPRRTYVTSSSTGKRYHGACLMRDGSVDGRRRTCVGCTLRHCCRSMSIRSSTRLCLNAAHAAPPLRTSKSCCRCPARRNRMHSQVQAPYHGHRTDRAQRHGFGHGSGQDQPQSCSTTRRQ